MKAQVVKEYPVKTDSECKKFVRNTKENQLVDKVIRREVYQITQLLGNKEESDQEV